MEIEDYRKQFMEQLRFDAEHEGTAPETQFIEKSLEILEETGDVSDAMPISIEIRGKRNRLMAFDAYAYDEADGALIMIASDFSNEIGTVQTLTNTRIDELYTRMRNFIEESVTGKMSDYCGSGGNGRGSLFCGSVRLSYRYRAGEAVQCKEKLRYFTKLNSGSYYSVFSEGKGEFPRIGKGDRMG